MKKVGLMTWFSYHNYGTVLQAVALYRVIKRLGYVPVLVNYLPKQKRREIRLSQLLSYIPKAAALLSSGGSYKDAVRAAKFDDFINTQLTFTEKCNTEKALRKLCADFDAFICGSDQIWSPANFDPHYFLDFVHAKKKIAFAPSFGLSSIADEAIKERMSVLIPTLDDISVREKQGVSIIKSICSIEAKLVLDPTLLLCAAEWMELLRCNGRGFDAGQGNFGLCYFLGNRAKNWSLVKRFCRDRKIQLNAIPRFNRDKFQGCQLLNGVGPIEFIHYMREASYVLTDSFHGLLFAILFEKDFYVFERFSADDDKNQNSRIYNILELFGIENRLIKNPEDFVKTVSLDYNAVQHVLSKLREESVEYLKNALSQ